MDVLITTPAKLYLACAPGAVPLPVAQAGWGPTKADAQKATAGWLSVLPIFEPHWQVGQLGLNGPSAVLRKPPVCVVTPMCLTHGQAHGLTGTCFLTTTESV